MIKFNKPENLNGSQLREELRSAGIAISDAPEAVIVNGDGELLLDIENSKNAFFIVENHVGKENKPKVSVSDLLQNLGISLEDLKSALNA